MLVSTFDVFDGVTSDGYKLPVFILGGLFLFSLAPYWSYRSSVYSLIDIPVRVVSGMSGKGPVGFFSVMVVTFMVVFPFNLVGMLPFSYPFSSHALYTLSLSGVVWGGLMWMGWRSSRVASVAHYLPKGSRSLLWVFLVIAEFVSSMIRPLTLGFRLAANMTAGHIILNLIALGLIYLGGFLGPLGVTLLGAGYTMFEVGVCAVQSFVLVQLCVLYSSDYIPSKLPCSMFSTPPFHGGSASVLA